PQTGIITPGRMDVKSSLEMIVWVAVGGRGTLGGPILGAIGVSLAYSFLTSQFPGSWLYFLGVLFITVVLFFPQGAVGVFANLKRGKPTTPKPVNGDGQAGTNLSGDALHLTPSTATAAATAASLLAVKRVEEPA
ncbi:MAG: hypothetical protein ABIW76_00330, partial [Fibrobacteria bacterium]